ncbi:MAG: hypothetical protein JWN48_5764 [Myxococcaceae bacterium]|nr:hypothetical protein [Myxococcaceae bacterium]
MPIELSTSQVQALASDAASALAGKKLGTPRSWTTLGQSSLAVWGQCQGSALYQTQVALADLVATCTCPSRKFPCKHALGLLFLAAESPDSLVSAPAPEWVTAWLANRELAQQKKQVRAESAASKPVDTAAQAKRADKRNANILAGIDQLDAWLGDLLRQGLGRLAGESPSLWDTEARRLVDAQAPGLAARVRRLSQWHGGGEAATSRLLDELGSLALLTHAYRRAAQLEPLLAADVRRLVGLTLDQAEVMAHGDAVEDEWTVLSDVIDEEERMRVQRAWLRGGASGRCALILQFAVAGAPFPEAWVSGTRFRARLAFWPSACPQRALIAERTGRLESSGVPTGDDVTGSLQRFSEQLALMPWLERDVFVLDRVVPQRAAVTSEPQAYWLLDHAERALPLLGHDHDVLLALSGGHPLTVVGEWDGYALVPQLAWHRARPVGLTNRSS